MTFLMRGSTLAGVAKTFVGDHPALRWYYLGVTISLVASVGATIAFYPARDVFVWTATLTIAVTGSTGIGILAAIAALVGFGLATASVLLVFLAGICTAGVTGAVSAELDGESAALHDHLAGVWRAKRALPVLALLLGTLGWVVVVGERRYEMLKGRPGFLGSLLGASPGTYAHLAVPIAALEGGGARHALRRSRELLADAYGDDVVATPGIVPTVGSTWLVPPILLGMAPLFFALVTGQDPSAVYDETIGYVAIPLVVLGAVGIARAIVLQSVFRAALFHHLVAETAPGHARAEPIAFLAAVQDAIDEGYGAPDGADTDLPDERGGTDTDTPDDDNTATVTLDGRHD